MKSVRYVYTLQRVLYITEGPQPPGAYFHGVYANAASARQAADGWDGVAIGFQEWRQTDTKLGTVQLTSRKLLTPDGHYGPGHWSIVRVPIQKLDSEG